MKHLAALFFALLLSSQLAAAFPAATATFFSKRGEPFQFIFDGHVVTHGSTNSIHINDIPAGYHTAEFRILRRRGILVHRTRVFLQPGRQSKFVVHITGHGQQAFVRKVAEIPLQPVYPAPVPDRPRYREPEPYHNDYTRPNHDHYDREERFEQDDNRYDQPQAEYRSGTCRDVMEKQQVTRLLQNMARTRSESSKESIARQALSQNSLLAEDVKAIMEQFDYESTRLGFAKFAYNATCDRRNFYIVNEAFTYDTSIRELEEYINAK